MHFHKTALQIAVEKEHIEIIKLLLAHNSINVNIKTILKFKYLMTFQFLYNLLCFNIY